MQLSLAANGQSNLQKILVSGIAIDSISKNTISGVQIVNMKTLTRFYSDENGLFFFQCSQQDTLYVTSKGYHPFAICFKDSAYKNSIVTTLKLARINVDLPEVTIKANRSFTEIHNDAQKLGYNKNDYMLHSVGSIMQSPFTYLYELLSKRAQDERAFAELTNYGKKQQLLRELIVKYNELDLLSIDADDVDRFIDYCDISEELLKTTTEYDFVRYLEYKQLGFQKTNHRPEPELQH